MFDATAGDLSSKIFGLMPHKSINYIYGALDMQSFSLPVGMMIFHRKTVSYFWLTDWIATVAAEERGKWFKEVIEDLSNGCPIFGNKIVKEFPLEEYVEAVKASKIHASEGKVLLKPQQ
jgi:NADPH:quinone reductase-like Zn-dependent oxidoreductase